MSDAITLPRIRLYPEREDDAAGWEQRIEARALGFKRALGKPLRKTRVSSFVRQVNNRREQLEGLDDSTFRQHIANIRRELVRRGFQQDCVVRSYAAIREAARRSIGLAHFDVQIEGARSLLDGAIAELETGEGKTLTATLAAGTAALAGVPVHVITVNDYLARRDAS